MAESSSLMQASRLELAARFQIPQRDLRLLDPWVPVPIPVSFLVRKHAILANFGAVRVLISRCEVCHHALNTSAHHETPVGVNCFPSHIHTKLQKCAMLQPAASNQACETAPLHAHSQSMAHESPPKRP